MSIPSSSAPQVGIGGVWCLYLSRMLVKVPKDPLRLPSLGGLGSTAFSPRFY